VATRASFFEIGPVHSFEEEWPEIARCLERFLASKGVDPWLRADIIQETASRLYGRWSGLDHSRPLWNLVVTVALRLLIDEHRRSSKVELVADAPQSEVDDVETRALHRVHLARTHSALEKLHPNQRQVLLAEIGEATPLDGSRNRINVMRLRARLALKGELGPWAPAGVAMRVRSLRAAIERRMVEWNQDNHAVVASVASVAVAASLFFAAAGPVGVEPKAPNLHDGVLGVLPVHDINLDPAIGAVKRVPPSSLSRAEDQAKKSVPPFAICAAVVCTGPEDPLVVGPFSADDALKDVEKGAREGDRQLRREEKKVRRILMDPPLP
jgi:hypothetical protein